MALHCKCMPLLELHKQVPLQFVRLDIDRGGDRKSRCRRILVAVDGPLANILKIKPPLVFSHADADRLIEALNEVQMLVLICLPLLFLVPYGLAC